MARIKQMAEQMDISIDKAEELADRASALNEKAGFKVGGVSVSGTPASYTALSGSQRALRSLSARAKKRRAAELEKSRRQLMAALKLGQTKKKSSSQAALVKKVFAGAKGGIVRGTRAQVRGRRFSGVY
jgi:sugar (pentulose or hexulose) kinase